MPASAADRSDRARPGRRGAGPEARRDGVRIREDRAAAIPGRSGDDWQRGQARSNYRG